jgi:hypothetical protein
VGVGIHFTAGPIFLEADFSAKHMVAQQDSWEQTALSFFAFDEQTFPSGRLSAGIKLADWFSLFGGIAVDGLIEGITDPTRSTRARRRSPAHQRDLHDHHRIRSVVHRDQDLIGKRRAVIRR